MSRSFRSTRLGRVSCVALAIVAMVLSACGREVVDPFVSIGRPATLAELTGPWRPTPLLLDAAMRGRVEQGCRRDIEFPPGSVAVVIDTRGAGVATVRMSGQNPGSCDALEITPTGEVHGAGGGGRGSDPENLPALDASTVGAVEKQPVVGGNLEVEGWSVYGRAGAAIAHVLIEPLNRPVVTATLVNGWFAAWWPAVAGEPPRDGARFPPFLARGYDAAGTLVDEVRG